VTDAMAPNLARQSGASPARPLRAYIGLGSNVGDPAASLARAVAALRALPEVRLGGISRLYVTRPVGVEDQPDFHNAVVALDMPAGPDPESGALALLVALKGLERAFGRQRRGRWGPRELDLDLLLFGAAEIVVERPPEAMSLDAATDLGRRPDRRVLVVPHPDAHERLFVLAPLADLAEELVPPGWHETVGTARAARERIEGPDAVRAVATWDDASGRWRPIDRADPR
jgi:2-amino-4-hydroxy-6-hydroxymethyldihydropteridine diphosphokinase